MFLADNQPRKLNEIPGYISQLAWLRHRWVGYSANVTLSQLECRSMTVPMAEIIRLRSMSSDSIILQNHTSQGEGGPDARGSFAESCSGRMVVCSSPGRAEHPYPPIGSIWRFEPRYHRGLPLRRSNPGYQTAGEAFFSRTCPTNPVMGVRKESKMLSTADTMTLGVRKSSLVTKITLSPDLACVLPLVQVVRLWLMLPAKVQTADAHRRSGA
ncbi:hypothetical protein BDW72DRAFT_20312 [Aspergillus terricola var. indicus]